ncbi:hypothetical protein E2F46_06355 [Luteimonas aestuarii]|uniref:Uncharacterized protein n=1 Tax=Luteimonas aestuarii TaxID=453837 RepID=A0A4R5TYC0_9GAMM|nr:hypothetical protein [Luteimonas aestuarii]TDK26216.1 hypothetical protein E2F46_06355 [Luteimonas aestuarii]
MGWGNGTDIHQVLPPYDLTHRPSTDGPAEVGQIVCTVVPEFGHPLMVFDAQRSDQIAHGSVSGAIRTLDHRCDYRPKPERLPVFKIGLGECEELLAIRSKMRPCVVLAIAEGIPDKHLPGTEVNIARPAFQRSSFLVAPAYSVSTHRDRRAIVPTIAARAECLMYPNLMLLPTSGGYLPHESVVRLDRAFWTTLPPPTELYQLSLSVERRAIMANQWRVMRGETPDADYVEMVELLREELAEAHRIPQ